MSRATLGDLLASLTDIDCHHSRLEVATAAADVIADILAASPAERAARGEVLVKCLRMTADQAQLRMDDEAATEKAKAVPL
jgi:hypothetical protein